MPKYCKKLNAALFSLSPFKEEINIIKKGGPFYVGQKRKHYVSIAFLAHSSKMLYFFQRSYF